MLLDVISGFLADSCCYMLRQLINFFCYFFFFCEAGDSHPVQVHVQVCLFIKIVSLVRSMHRIKS
jgi:hypothetical protein